MTTPDALRAAAGRGDAAAIRALIAPLPEAERAELLPVAREIVAAAVARGFDADLASMLAVAYGVLPVSEIRRLGWRSNHVRGELGEVLRRRSTDRLVPIVDHLLDAVGGTAWPIVRPLVREGIVPRPDGPSYTIAMLAATRHGRAARLVADDPELLEVEAWRLFEVEGGGEDSLANHEKFFGDTWGAVFRDLAARDAQGRARLLDASLAALARDFSAYRAGWFSRFHESLEPTDDERADRHEAYLGLVRSRVGPTVSFAVAALARVQRAGRLPPASLLERIGPVLADAPAGTAKASLRLVGGAGASSPDLAHRAAVVAADALVNPSPDVQRAAVTLIGTLGREGDEALARAVADRLVDVAASQRPAATELVARLGGTVPAGSAADSDLVGERPPAGAEAAVTTPRTVSPTGPDRAIEPLASIDELVDVAVSVLESGEPADDVERVLDAVGRLAAERSGQFDRLTAAVARRARVILGRRGSAAFTGFDAASDVAAVLLAWATGEVVEPAAAPRSVDPGAGAFLSARARELAEAVAAGRAFAGVAAPTHRGGWIDPAVLVRRLLDRPPASVLDLVAAILRLAPVGREAALSAASDLPGEAGAAVRYALGGVEAVGTTAPWWVAAARVRAPGRDDERVEARHPRLGPDAGLAARVRLRARDGQPSFAALWLEIEPPLVEVHPRPPGGIGVDLPTVGLLRTPSSFTWSGRSEPAMLRWTATIQPGDRETWAAIGSLRLGWNVDWWSAEWANRAYLEPFVDPVTPIGPHARTLVGIALGAKEAGERGLAGDVVRAALDDGRLTGPTLAEGLVAAAAAGSDRPNRWAVSLSDAAAGSTGRAVAVAEALARSLPALAGRPPAKLVPLLRLLDELLAATGAAAVPEGRPSLEGLAGGGGQAGRLARSILARG